MSDNVAAILTSMAAKRLSREALAHEAGISISTLNKILSGGRPLSFAQRIRLGNALGIDLAHSEQGIAPAQVAPDDLGAYTRAAVCWMEGAYLAVRHSFNRDDSLVSYAITIDWDHTTATLSFVTRDDFAAPALQRGKISFSMRTGHSYLISNDLGRFDLTILGRPAEEGRLLGLCTTAFLHMGRPTPASSAIVLMPVDFERPLPACGPIIPDDPYYRAYLAWLNSAETDGFASVVSATPLSSNS